MKIRELIISRNIFIFGILVLVVSLPSSPYFTSIGQWLMVLGWLFDNPIARIKKASKDKTWIVFLLLIGVHVISMLWSDNLSYGLHDLKIKIPLLIIPLMLATSEPLTVKEFKLIAYGFIIAVLAISLYGIARFHLQDPDDATYDYRKISPFISHIRLAMMQNIAIALVFYFLSKNNNPISISGIIQGFLIILLVSVLIVMKALSGVILLLIMAGFIALLKIISSKNFLVRWAFVVTTVSFVFFVVNYFIRAYARYNYKINYNYAQLPEYTVNGNPYKHDTTQTLHENGHAVYLFICEKELREQWQRRSKVPYDSVGYPSQKTLIRYMASKGLTKDSVGVAALTNEDICAIENGVATTVSFENYSFYPRLYELFREFEEYRLSGDPNNKSVVQRYYYLKAGWAIFLENFWFGVGVGDVKDSFDSYYQKVNSKLIPEKRLRAHNQFLTSLISFGIVGFLIVIVSIFYPILIFGTKKKINLLFLIFFMISILSMLSEDTLETQAGATFFALFYSLFSWGFPKEYSLADSAKLQ